MCSFADKEACLSQKKQSKKTGTTVHFITTDIQKCSIVLVVL